MPRSYSDEVIGIMSKRVIDDFFDTAWQRLPAVLQEGTNAIIWKQQRSSERIRSDLSKVLAILRGAYGCGRLSVQKGMSVFMSERKPPPRKSVSLVDENGQSEG
jgi:hypothetical protein